MPLRDLFFIVRILVYTLSMSQEIPSGQSPEVKSFESAKFAELFDEINKEGLDVEYRNAYEEAVEIAKKLVDARAKSSWSAYRFEDDMMRAYPDLPHPFIAALCRCVEGYNPPVNIPDAPLWE